MVILLVNSNANLLTDKYTMQVLHSQLLNLNYTCVWGSGARGATAILLYFLTLCSFIILWFVDLNQNLCDFDLNQFRTIDFDLI